ncbi:MAG: AMP-binding protein [Candidatus Omnitrophica bacterium]|nr:AMP-binding protein [Candidatus Omnitrophota bacterium]
MPRRNKVISQYDLSLKKDIIRALKARGGEQKALFEKARKVRDDHFGKRVEVRSVIEYSNLCQQACNFCGMNVKSRVKRYVLADEAVLKRVKRLYRDGRKVIMFQTGECQAEDYFNKLFRLLKKIKRLYHDITLIGCFGNLSDEQYKMLKSIGIERYILKFETSSPLLYRKIKPSDTLSNRLSHLEKLKKMGFQVSSGNIVGLPGQSIESIADDLLLLRELDIPMGSTSAFIPNELSSYAGEKAGELDLALNFTAILRIMCPEMLIPTTSSLESLVKKGQLRGLKAGANTVTVHDGTPRDEENRFVIYKLGRYIPKHSLLEVVKKAGLTPSNTSLIRDRSENSLYHELVLKNLGKKTPAVYSDGKRYTYKNLSSMSNRFTSFLLEKGLVPGDTAVIALDDSIELVVCLLSCIRLGIRAAIADPLLSKKEWKNLLKDVNPGAVLTTREVSGKHSDKRFLSVSAYGTSEEFTSLLDKYPEIDRVVAPDHNNTALILFTSGSTGRPKGVMHTYRNLSVDSFARTVLKMNKKDISFSCSRMHTSFGFGNSFLFPFLTGGGVILSRTIPNPYSIRRILKPGPTLFFAVPQIYSVLLPHAAGLKRHFKSVRHFVSSGEKLTVSLFNDWKTSCGVKVLECLGATELCHPFVSNRPGRERPGTCGRPVEGFQVRTDKKGVLSYRGPSLFTGYLNDKKLTRKSLKNGWFRSDDMGYIDKDGYLFFKGRDNLVVKSGGNWISFCDIEKIIEKCPVVKEAAVAKKADKLHYYVTVRKGSTSSYAVKKIRKHCLGQMKMNQLPDEIHVLEELPRTRSGKIRRASLG